MGSYEKAYQLVLSANIKSNVFRSVECVSSASFPIEMNAFFCFGLHFLNLFEKYTFILNSVSLYILYVVVVAVVHLLLLDIPFQ